MAGWVSYECRFQPEAVLTHLKLNMWKRSEIEEHRAYRVALCQAPNGLRTFRLVADGCEAPHDSPLCTEVVPHELLQGGQLHAIARTVKLTSGESFWVDAHGVWFTRPEADALNEDDEGEIPWLNGLPPLLAPK